MQLHFHKTELHLKETFSIAYGNYDKRDALVVKLSHLGKDGYGECVSINYYGIYLEDFVLKLKEIQPRIENQKIIHPKDFFAFLEQFQLHHFLLSALDCAYWDLFGKLENKNFNENTSNNQSNLISNESFESPDQIIVKNNGFNNTVSEIRQKETLISKSKDNINSSIISSTNTSNDQIKVLIDQNAKILSTLQTISTIKETISETTISQAQPNGPASPTEKTKNESKTITNNNSVTRQSDINTALLMQIVTLLSGPLKIKNDI